MSIVSFVKELTCGPKGHRCLIRLLAKLEKKYDEEIEWFTRGSLLMASYVNLLKICSDLQPFT